MPAPTVAPSPADQPPACASWRLWNPKDFDAPVPPPGATRPKPIPKTTKPLETLKPPTGLVFPYFVGVAFTLKELGIITDDTPVSPTPFQCA